MKSAPFTPKRANKFICEICDLKCCKLSDWIRHTLTAKHTMLMNANGFTPKSGAILECICGKNYKHMSSLCKHKKICPDVNQYNLLHTNKSNVYYTAAPVYLGDIIKIIFFEIFKSPGENFLIFREYIKEMLLYKINQ